MGTISTGAPLDRAMTAAYLLWHGFAPGFVRLRTCRHMAPCFHIAICALVERLARSRCPATLVELTDRPGRKD